MVIDLILHYQKFIPPQKKFLATPLPTTGKCVNI